MKHFNSVIINDMQVFNNELYVAGNFDSVDGITNTKDIVKWNGTQWEGVGGGVVTDGFIGMTQLEVYNNELYAFGDFTNIGGVVVNYFARWNGSAWNEVPFSGPFNVWSLYDMKTWGNSLFISGYFTTVNGVNAPGIAQWDGT